MTHLINTTVTSLRRDQIAHPQIDTFLMPVIFYVYVCQQLDKSSISFASVFGFSTDAGLVGQDYSWLGSIVYFAQLVFQPRELRLVEWHSLSRSVDLCVGQVPGQSMGAVLLLRLGRVV